MDNTERRRTLRVRVKCRATVRGSSSWIFSICENISEEGFFIRDVGNEETGNHVKLELELPDRDYPLITEGRVVWRIYNGSRSGGGLVFTRMLKTDREWLADFIDKLSADESEDSDSTKESPD